jgi:hypothetical protein
MMPVLALLLAAAGPAQTWQCSFGYPDRPNAYRWSIVVRADDGLSVTDERGRAVQARLVARDPAQLVFALNSIRWDAKRLVKGRVRATSYSTGSVARLEIRTGSLAVDNSVTDADGMRLDLAAIEARAAEEEALAAESGKPPPNNPMFWMLLRIAATPQSGICVAGD